MNKQNLARWGEQRAAEYLKSHGYEILARNYRCRAGEIDIIASKGRVLCIAEVKTRSSTEFGLPCEAVDERKKQRIRRAAQAFLARYPAMDEFEWSLDVIELLVLPHGRYIRHVKGAF